MHLEPAGPLPGVARRRGPLHLAATAAAAVLREPFSLLGAMAASSTFWLCLLALTRRWESLLLPLLRGELALQRELVVTGLLLFAFTITAVTLGGLSLGWQRIDLIRAPRLVGALCTTAATTVLAGGLLLFCQLTALIAALCSGLIAGQMLQAAALLALVALPCSLLLTFLVAGSHLALARIRASASAPRPLAGPALLAHAVANLLADPLRSLRLLGMLGLVTAPGWVIAGLSFPAAVSSPRLAVSFLLLLPAALGSGAAAAIMARGLQQGLD